MKSITQVVATIRKQLEDRWHQELVDGARWWSRSYPLGEVASTRAAEISVDLRAWIRDWHEFASTQGGPEHGVELSWRTRMIGKPSERRAERVPTHLVVADLDAAARIAGPPWPDRIEAARSRFDVLRSEFPGTADARSLKLIEPLSDVDFGLARVTARWFAEHEPEDWEWLTPRQVPIKGVHGKWLDSHRRVVQALAGLERLELQVRPTRIHFTYLDPDYLRSGRRRHDSHTLKDDLELPYRPRLVLILENKDTSILFPELPGAMAIEGNGNASVGLLPGLSWISKAEQIVYWGDLDRRGYRIVNDLRSRLPRVRTILMDQPTYDEYEPFGTDLDHLGRPIRRGEPEDLTELTPAEREVYRNLTDHGWSRHLRVEQERIPLAVARALVG